MCVSVCVCSSSIQAFVCNPDLFATLNRQAAQVKAPCTRKLVYLLDPVKGWHCWNLYNSPFKAILPHKSAIQALQRHTHTPTRALTIHLHHTPTFTLTPIPIHSHSHTPTRTHTHPPTHNRNHTNTHQFSPTPAPPNTPAPTFTHNSTHPTPTHLPAAPMATGACSREDPHPKFCPPITTGYSVFMLPGVTYLQGHKGARANVQDMCVYARVCVCELICFNHTHHVC